MQPFIRPLFLFLFASLFFQSLQSQSVQGQTISGKITNNEGEELIGANINFRDAQGNYGTGASTDFDGNYKVSVDRSKIAWIEVTYVGYLSVRQAVGEEKRLDIAMESGISFFCEYYIVPYKIPLIDFENTSSGQSFSSEEIRNSPIKDIREITSSVPGVSFNNW